MNKISYLILAVFGTFIAFCYVLPMTGLYLKGTYYYKMTVTVDTPEGLISGSAVRSVTDSRDDFGVNLGMGGGRPDIAGEAVVVDLGKRGVLFALINWEEWSRLRKTLPAVPEHANSPVKGLKYYLELPVGTKGVVDPIIPPSYPKLVMFKDIADPLSVTLAQEWNRRKKDGLFEIKADRMEELFGVGVKLKEITIEITDEPVTWGVVDRYLSKEFWKKYKSWMKSMMIGERGQYINLFNFKKEPNQ